VIAAIIPEAPPPIIAIFKFSFKLLKIL